MRQQLEDSNGTIRAEIEITSVSDNLFLGHIIKEYFTVQQKELFSEFEQMVNDQVFSLLDEIEDKIAEFGFRIKNDTDEIFDLQIFNMKDLSYRKKEIKK